MASKQTSEDLSFRVSSGLKNIIGRDLISDKFIAIFELVKNSFDAGAHNVLLRFDHLDSDDATISIEDDGFGMSYQDIKNKWLFVAYSEKKPRNQGKDFREKIKRNVAGAKGVGRFSCDRLGASLTIVTKTASDTYANQLEIDWDKFEIDDLNEFINIPVVYNSILDSSLKNCGTILRITRLREEWDRATVLKLKKSLMKLINPEIENGTDSFSIVFDVPEMKADDQKIILENKLGWERNVVNGKVYNDVFEKLNIKTTSIFVSIPDDGRSIQTALYDRGEFIFKFIEKNKDYTLLHGIQVKLFYMNKSAKQSFTRQMGGVQPVNYGSVFVYKNGFRVNPYGDPGEDVFSIDKRKAQGYNRNLGTREIMGRIIISGDNDEFVETSSRANGFVLTPSVEMLSQFFLQKVLKVLERYVVNIICWGEPLKTDPSRTIMPLDVADQIVDEFADISRKHDLISIDYNPALLSGDADKKRENGLAASIEKLEKVAQRSGNQAVLDLTRSVRSRTAEIMNQNADFDRQIRDASKELKQVKIQNSIREKQVFFLQGVANNTTKNLTNGMHLIYTSTEVARGYIDDIKELLKDVTFPQASELVEYLSEIEKANRKANKIAELAIHGSQDLKQTDKRDIAEYIQQYVKTNMVISGIKYYVQAVNKPCMCIFDPVAIGIIIDNAASNSKKAKSSQLNISFSEDSAFIYIHFIDDGVGLNGNVNIDSLFEYGVSENSMQKGFGIGLNEIKELSEEMGGTAKINAAYTDGFELVVSIKK